MAGRGKRFQNADTLPKPLIKINNFPMFKLALDSLPFFINVIFIVKKLDIINFNIDKEIKKYCKHNFKIIEVDKITKGQACSALLAEKYITKNSLIISNCDHFIDWNYQDFFNKSLNKDGGIITFITNELEPKYSYAKTDDNNNVIEVAEKKIISEFATAGIYFFSKGTDFIKYSKRMIAKNIKINNEFYVAPIYNEMIQDNKKIINFVCNKIISTGTPEDIKKLALL